MGLMITGFGRFMDGPNCSQILLEALAAQRPELERIWRAPIAFELLPVDVEAVRPALERLLRTAAPSHLLLMGQAGGRDAICLERVARNRIDLGVPDSAGRLGTLGPVSAGGPDQMLANWPDPEGVVSAIKAAGAPARLSDDAGGHLCNQTLYLALEAAGKAAEGSLVATFLHLPLLPEQIAAGFPAAQGVGCSVALDDMKRAVRAILRHTRQTAV